MAKEDGDKGLIKVKKELEVSSKFPISLLALY